MKPFILILTIFCFIQASFSQHSYTNPRERQKKMLLEESEEKLREEEILDEGTVKNEAESRFTRGQSKFCACEKTYFLSLKRAKLRRKLARKNLIKHRFRQQQEFTRHMRSSLEATKLMRGKYEIEEGFDCLHSDLDYKKISEYTQAISGLVDQCDIEIITESY